MRLNELVVHVGLEEGCLVGRKCVFEGTGLFLDGHSDVSFAADDVDDFKFSGVIHLNESSKLYNYINADFQF